MGLHRKIAIAVFSLCFVVAVGSVRAADTEAMSLDSLMNIPITAASKHEQTSLEAPASVTVISSDDIRAYGWRNLEDALNSVRGFYISDDRNYSYLGSRGYLRPTDYNNRILLLLDGHSLNESVQGSSPVNTLFALDLSIVDRIEVIRGPGSALYGTGAMFAVINVVTKHSDAISGVQACVSAASPRGAGACLNYGKVLRGKWSVVLSAQANDQRGDDLYLKEYDDSLTNFGVVKDLDWERTQGAYLRIARGDLALNAYALGRWKGIPTMTWGTTFNDSRSQTQDNTGGLFVDYRTELSSKLALFSRAHFNSFHYEGVYPYEPVSPDNPEYMNDRRIGLELRGDWNPVSYERLIFGSEYINNLRNEYWSGTTEEIYFDISHPSNDVSLFAQNDFQFNANTILTAGLRQTWYSQGWRATVPRAALVYLPTRRSSLKLLYGEAFRVPGIQEAFYWFPEQTKANPDLKPERIRTLELNAEFRLVNALHGSVSVYDYLVSDLINTVTDESDGLNESKNTGEASGRGAEFELTYRASHGIGGYASWAWQQTAEGPDDQSLTNSPRNLVHAGLNAPVFRRYRAALEAQAEGSRYTLYRTKTAAFMLINGALSTSPDFGPLQATLYVRNLLDTAYEFPGGWEHLEPVSTRDMLTIPQRGRSAGMKFTYNF